MTHIMQQLLSYSLTLAVLAGGYLVASLWMRRRYAAKWLYLAGVILLVAFLFPFRPQIPIAPQGTPAFLLGLTNPRDFVFTPAERAASTPPPAGQVSVWLVIFMVWIAGAGCVLLCQGVKHARFCRAVRRWSSPVRDEALLAAFARAKQDLSLQNQRISLKHCACLSSPMLVWLGKPTILLPEESADAQATRYIFLHELVHYQRKDLLCRLVMLVVAAMHWFNPMVYPLIRAVTLQCEISCDDKVVENQDAMGRHQYALSIIGVVQAHARRYPLLTTSFYGGKDTMKKRIASIFSLQKKKARLLLACAIALALVAGISFATDKPTAGVRYLAVTSGYSPYERVPGLPEEIAQTDDIIQATIVNGWRPMPLRLPEGSAEAEEYALAGVWVTLDEPFAILQDEETGTASYSMPRDTLLEPTAIAMINPLAYGIIVEITEDALVVEAVSRFGEALPNNPQIQYTLTADTIFADANGEGSFVPGAYVTLIADEQGVALAILSVIG
ncbi:MAG: M56 family metallopeptidase [Oscillospiraceae bacterium]|jgi:beta-lactamase regulating signal transducer with metallopeptidase domain|nr:M56 family metallopeptidase [Oscillospiraceae bacterium]